MDDVVFERFDREFFIVYGYDEGMIDKFFLDRFDIGLVEKVFDKVIFGVK